MLYVRKLKLKLGINEPVKRTYKVVKYFKSEKVVKK